jgi:hypothetical protein
MFTRSVLAVDKFSASDIHGLQFMTLQLRNFSATYLGSSEKFKA